MGLLFDLPELGGKNSLAASLDTPIQLAQTTRQPRTASTHQQGRARWQQPLDSPHLETFFEQNCPDFELLSYARQESDQGLQLARRVSKRYPAVRDRFFTSDEPLPDLHNAKVFWLEKRDSEAAHDEYIISDADVRVERDHLRQMVQKLRKPTVGLASYVYRGTAHEDAGFASRLDAVGRSVEMTSGVPEALSPKAKTRYPRLGITKDTLTSPRCSRFGASAWTGP